MNKKLMEKIKKINLIIDSETLFEVFPAFFGINEGTSKKRQRR
jgi:hypothetical protein